MQQLPILMGILNITPDSFYAGSRIKNNDAVLFKAQQMIEEGADWLDVGGESTRPGALPVSEQEELDRVIPVIEAIMARFDMSVSIDTNKAQVMKHALAAGASMINDIWALRQPDALSIAAQSDVPVCLMHMQGEPTTMQENPTYDEDILAVIKAFFEERIAACHQAGIARERLILDPGIGFGKTLPQNQTILKRLSELNDFGLPILIGVSRKTMIGQIVNKPADERLFGTLGATIVAVQNGATIIRTHDIGATADALKVMLSIGERNQYERII
jgi:dihydropteroate synthase